jgi:hypothetical protein
MRRNPRTSRRGDLRNAAIIHLSARPEAERSNVDGEEIIIGEDCPTSALALRQKELPLCGAMALPR